MMPTPHGLFETFSNLHFGRSVHYGINENYQTKLENAKKFRKCCLEQEAIVFHRVVVSPARDR